MKKQYLRFVGIGISFLAIIIFTLLSSVALGQNHERPSNNFTDDVIPGYKGWTGNPDSITIIADASVNKDSLALAVKRLNDAGAKPKLKIVNSEPPKAQISVKIDPALPDTAPGLARADKPWGTATLNRVDISVDPQPDLCLTELLTHELGHAIGCDDTPSDANPRDAMKGFGPNGTSGNLSKHDSAEIKAAANFSITPVKSIVPPVAVTPGQTTGLQFPLGMIYPPGSGTVTVHPVGDPYITVGPATIVGDMLLVDCYFSPDHWSGKFYLDIHIDFLPPFEPVDFRGWQYINIMPVPPTVFDCPFVVTSLPDNSTMIEWRSTCTYPLPDANLQSILTINNQFSYMNKGCGPYILPLPSGTYTLKLDVNDYQGNTATNTQTITVTTPGSYNIPSPAYPTIAAAILSLNSLGVPPGGATFNVDAGYTETGVNLILNTPTGSSGSPIVFQKNPYQPGANPLLTVSPGGVGLTDGGIIIAGTDYVTFNQIDIDASAQPTIEWGYALVKRQNLAPFDGCQNVTINNCKISMNRTNQSSVGIYAGNHITTATTALIITATTDAHNFCSFSGNTIDNAYNGMYIRGYNAPSPYDLYDHYNTIGVDGKNIITNFGGAAGDAYGIYAQYQDMMKITNDSIISAPGSTGRVAGIATTGGVQSSIEISYNEISVTSSGVGLKNLYGIWSNLGSGNTTNTIEIHHNIIKNCTFPTATTGPMYGILNTANPATIKIYNNEIYNSTYPGTSSSNHAINCGASGTNAQIYNNYIHNMTTTGTNNLTLIIVSSFATIDVYGNTISYCSANGGVVSGIQAGTCATLNAYKNKIMNLSSGGTSGMVYGINNVGAATANIYNNYISELQAAASLANPAIIGMNLNGGSTTNVYYNTVYLDQAIAGSPSFGSCALYSGTATNTTLANNILVNVSAHGTTGYTVAYRRSTNNLATYSLNSDNNDFYAGIPGPNDLIYYDGTTPVPMLPAYQALVAPRDAASFTENPPFKNISLSPYNLHILSGVTTACESGGKVATPPLIIMDDYDGHPRFPNPGYPDNPSQPATAPDVGADEFPGGIILPPLKTLTLSLNLEGLFDDFLGMMRVSNDEFGPHFLGDTADLITVSLHRASDYSGIVHSVPNTKLSTAGTATVIFPSVYQDWYYISINHRNSIETTTADSISFAHTAIHYSFDTPSKAYGDNMGITPGGTTVIYSGDSNQDWLVDGTDLSNIGNSADIAVLGYVPEDLNGDGLVDGSDLSIAGNNSDAAIGAITP